MTQPQAKLVGRFLLIDGLRGVAAMMVVVYHLHDALPESVHFPNWMMLGFGKGDLGVDIFFVLSGFVIPHSVRNGRHTLKYLGAFALRRSIRLDPPLWITIAIDYVLIRAGLAFFPDLGTPIPTLGEIAVNVLYLQEFLAVRNIIPAFWSLTYEVQFYLVVVASLVGWRWVRSQGSPSPLRSGAAVASMVCVFLYSVLIWHQVVDTPLRGLFVERWFQFFLGALAWATTMGKVRIRYYSLACLACLISALLFAEESYRFLSTVSAVLTSSLILWAGLTGRMANILAGRTTQFFGRISYSLYLLHLPIGWRFVSLAGSLLGEGMSTMVGFVVLAGGIGVSILSAWIMYRLIEAPSIQFARRVRLESA